MPYTGNDSNPSIARKTFLEVRKSSKSRVKSNDYAAFLFVAVYVGALTSGKYEYKLAYTQTCLYLKRMFYGTHHPPLTYPKKNRRKAREYDKALFKLRHLAENAIGFIDYVIDKFPFRINNVRIDAAMNSRFNFTGIWKIRGSGMLISNPARSA